MGQWVLPLALSVLPTVAAAQTGSATGTEPSSGMSATASPGATVMAPTLSGDNNQQYPRFGRNLEHSVGFRFWLWNTPAWEVGLFVHIEPGWSGPLTPAVGPEYVYRKGNLDVVLGIQYQGMGADVGYFRGRNEADNALESVRSELYAVYANALFLWGTRFNDWFELQYGAGVGLGYLGGDLYRNQAYRDPRNQAISDCMGPGNPVVTSPGGFYCGSDNNHYNGFTEPRLTSNPSGSIPPVLPWVSLPHVALHFRPHRYVDIRVDGGFGIVGFYGGLASHFIFD